MKVGAVITLYSRWVGNKDTEGLRSLPMVMVLMVMQLVCESSLAPSTSLARSPVRKLLALPSLLTLVLCPPATKRLG